MTILQRCYAAAQGWLNAGLGFVYPEVCCLCGGARATPVEAFLCGKCRAQIRFIQRPFCERCGLPFEGEIHQSFECTNCRDRDWHFLRARSAVLARGAVLEAIHHYKYRRALWLEPFLAELLICQARPELSRERWDWIIPVPLHPAKQREREFNQSERLARRLSLATRIPLNTRCLERTVATRTQTLLSREERLENVRKAFALRGHPKLEGARTVLLDDVFTTGATTDACAKVLCQAGAEAVCVWTVARGV